MVGTPVVIDSSASSLISFNLKNFVLLDKIRFRVCLQTQDLGHSRNMKYKLPVRTQRLLNIYDPNKPAVAAERNAGLDFTRDLTTAQQILEGNKKVYNVYRCALDINPLVTGVYSVKKPSPEPCSCDKDQEIERDGCYVCCVCGEVKGPVYITAQAWHGTSTIVRAQKYDFMKYADNTYLRKLLSKIPYIYTIKIKAVLPKLYETFFKVAPGRKNFMSYGFVLRKLLEMMGVDHTCYGVPTVKTPSKVRACEAYWKAMLARVDLKGL